MGFKIKKTVNGETVWEPIKAKKYTSSKTIEYTGALPITINANGSALLDYRIYGNTEQTGTPTPENPIMPEGVGERTENLFDGTLLNGAWSSANMSSRVVIGAVYRSMKLTLSPGIYTLVFSENVYLVRKIVNDVYSEPNTETSGMTFTVETLSDVGFSFRMPASFQTPWDNNVLISVNLGSTALPYEPYGYKLPILSNSTVTSIYLGEAETTRRIKKLVLTGEEDWRNVLGSDTQSRVYLSLESASIGMCTHYVSGDALNPGEFDLASGIYLRFNVSGVATTRTEWIDYLAAQYTAGTPVTVWYVLAEPETGTVNEPLMKIGDYVDTVSMEQAGVSIPTNKGTTVIDYDGTPKPTQMYVKYNSWSGWSDIDNYKMVNGNWTQEMT